MYSSNKIKLTHGGHIDRSGLVRCILRSPELRDRFGLGVELNSSLAIEIQIALNGSSATSEGEHGQRYRDRDIDSNLTDIDFFGELASNTARVGKDGGSVSISISIDDFNRFIESLCLHTDEHLES
jgi:hypothetical protein